MTLFAPRGGTGHPSPATSSGVVHIIEQLNLGPNQLRLRALCFSVVNGWHFVLLQLLKKLDQRLLIPWTQSAEPPDDLARITTVDL